MFNAIFAAVFAVFVVNAIFTHNYLALLFGAFSAFSILRAYLGLDKKKR